MAAVITRLLCVVFCLTALGIGCDRKTEPAESDSPAAAKKDSVVFEFVVTDTTTPFEVLQATHDIDYVSSAMGVFVKTIDSVTNSTTHFWIYSVNDTMPKTASDKLTVAPGDVVKWHFRRTGT